MSDQYMNGMKTKHLSFELTPIIVSKQLSSVIEWLKKEKNKLLGMSKKYKIKG